MKKLKDMKMKEKVREDTSRKGLPGDRNGRAILDWNKVYEIRNLHTRNIQKSRNSRYVWN
jgi:hypothetical protein